MTTKAKHAQRSHRNHRVYFQSKDKAYHGYETGDIYKQHPIYKDHPKKYDGKGNKVVINE